MKNRYNNIRKNQLFENKLKYLKDLSNYQMIVFNDYKTKLEDEMY